MKISRRKFIEAAPVIAGAVLGFKSVAFGQKGRAPLTPVPAGIDQLSRMSWDSFYPYQHTEFTFRSGGVDVPLMLESMVDTAPHVLGKPRTNMGECFVLKFTGPGRYPLKQGTYDVNHFLLGDFRLFITAGGQAKRGNYYVAVVNRIVN